MQQQLPEAKTSFTLEGATTSSHVTPAKAQSSPCPHPPALLCQGGGQETRTLKRTTRVNWAAEDVFFV